MADCRLCPMCRARHTYVVRTYGRVQKKVNVT